MSLEIIYKKFTNLVKESSENKIESHEIMALLCDLSPNLKIIENTKRILEGIGANKEIIARMDTFLESNWYLNYLINRSVQC